jgi:site-specific DNA-cytosine methylase
MKFLSLFSGIEAASVAFTPLGWKCVGVAEIEKFPCRVLAHHYPDVPNLGDVLADDFIERAKSLNPDILCGGPPCQDFSIAGLRAGLAGNRGNLTLRYVEIINAIRPLYSLTENVPGWLSVNGGAAFGAFLAGLVGADEALIPPKKCGGRWDDAGMVSGPQGRAAWRITDAQFFGLAQRRKRVFVVGCFGNRLDPAAILFESKSLCGNPAPRRKTGQEIAPTIRAGAANGGKGHGARSGDSKDELIPPTYRWQNDDAGIIEDAVSPTLRRESATTDERSVPAYALSWPADIAPTLDAHYGDKMGLENQHINAGGGLFVHSPVPDGQQPENRCGNGNVDPVSRGYL